MDLHLDPQQQFLVSLERFFDSAKRLDKFDRDHPGELHASDPAYWMGSILFVTMLGNMFIGFRDLDNWLRS